jgi:superfamily I DNA/RNA helicase
MDRTLNEKQRQVAENLTDNILLYASAGTGKTYTLAMRVANILSQGLAKAEEVLCLTFTVKACGEMRDDITAYAGEKAKNACIKTIHGFCYMLVREEEKRSGKARTEVSVCDDADEERLLRKILSARYHFWEYGVETEEEKTFSIYEKPTALRVLVSTVKHARLSGGIFSENAENDYQNALALLKERGEGYDELFSHYAKYTGQVCDEAFQSAIRSQRMFSR